MLFLYFCSGLLIIVQDFETMKKKRIDIEYPLSSRQTDIVWRLISTDHGLGRWLADEVNEDNGRFRWVEEDDPQAFWEMRIGRSELTGDLCLCVIDYAPEDEVDDLRSLWDDNMERLHMTSGL